MSESFPFEAFIEHLRISGVALDTAPNGRAAFALRLNDGSRLIAYIDDNANNPTGITIDWIPASWSMA